MLKNKLLNEMAAAEGEFPFISLFLNTERNGTGKPDFPTFVKNEVSRHEDKFEDRSEEKKNFDEDVAKINEFLDGIDDATRGVAVFACSRANIFATAEFEVPFEESHFFVFERPHLYPLVRLLEQNPPFAVLIADTNAASIYVFKRGETVRQKDIQNVKTNRTEVGGWSQARFQRHIENFHQQHAKEAVAELEKIVMKNDIKHVLLAGDETVIIPLLKDEMSQELDARLAGTLKLNVHTPEHELLDAAEQAIKQHDTLDDMKKIEQLTEQDYDGGIGVTGIEKTMAALLNGQVQELYISADFDTLKYDETELANILNAYAPGAEGELPGVRKPGMVVDELLRQAVGSAERIRFIEDASLLEAAGGVGALLRYQAKGVTNQ